MTLIAAFNWTLVALATSCVLLAVSIGLSRVGRVRRERAAERLVEPLRPCLLDLVTGDDDEVARAAARLDGLDETQWRAVQDVLVDFVAKFRGEALRPVLDLLARRHVVDRAREELTALLAERRGRAAHTLGLLRDSGSRRRLVALLRDRDAEVRIVAARALGRLRDPAVAQPLLVALAGGRPVPAGVITSALLELGPAITPDIALALGSDDPTTRQVACDVAGLSGAVGLVERLGEVITTDRSADVRARAATALGRLGDPVALGALLGATAPDEDGTVRVAATAALGALGDASAVATLSTLLGDQRQLAEVAATALAQLGDPGLRALRAHAVDDQPSPAAAVLAVTALRAQSDRR